MLINLNRGIRSLVRDWGFTSACVASLAIGVGLNGVAFSMVDATLLRKPPYQDPDRIVAIQDSRQVPDDYLLSRGDFETLDSSLDALAGLAAFRAGMGYHFQLHLASESTPAIGVAVTSNLFDVLGRRAQLGRTLRVSDDSASAIPVVVIGAALWKRAFNRDPNVVGKLVRVEGRLRTIVGVMPSDFWFPIWDTEFWVPIGSVGDPTTGEAGSLSAVGRLRDGASLSLATSQVATVGKHLDGVSRGGRPRWWRVEPLTQVNRPADIGLLLLLQILAGCVLVLACLNVSTLMLVRASTRAHDHAIQIALGAPRWRRLQPLAVEAALLAALLAAASGALALLGTNYLASALGRPMVGNLIVAGWPDTVVLAVLGACLSVFLCAVAPAIVLARVTLGSTLRTGGRGLGLGRFAMRMRRAGVGIEFACALALCTIALMLLRNVAAMANWVPGFPVEGLTVVTERASPGVDLSSGSSRLEEVLRGVPGVTHVSLVESEFPVGGIVVSDVGTRIHTCDCRRATEDIVGTIGMTMMYGRQFAAADGKSVPSAIVDATFARSLWHSDNVVGRRFKFGEMGQWATIVGVVTATALQRPWSPQQPPEPVAFLLSTADSLLHAAAFVRSAPGRSVRAGVRRAVVNTGDPAPRIVTMRQALNSNLGPLQSYARLIGFLAALAIVLGAIGIHGLLAYYVAVRRRELGIRAALGATPGTLFRSIVRDATVLLAISGVCGAVLAIAAGRVLMSILVTTDQGLAMPLMLAFLTLVAVGAGTAVLPARRAARTSPSDVLAA